MLLRMRSNFFRHRVLIHQTPNQSKSVSWIRWHDFPFSDLKIQLHHHSVKADSHSIQLREQTGKGPRHFSRHFCEHSTLILPLPGKYSRMYPFSVPGELLCQRLKDSTRMLCRCYLACTIVKPCGKHRAMYLPPCLHFATLRQQQQQPRTGRFHRPNG